MRKNLTVLICASFGILFLCTLGTWQVQRMAWKQGLIAQVEARTNQAPIRLAQVPVHGDIEYVRIADVGTLEPGKVLYMQATLGGTAGWKVIAPFQSQDGIWVLVDLGVFAKRDFQIPEMKALSGLIRLHNSGPSIYDAANDPPGDLWFWWDVPEMQKALGLNGKVAPFVVQVQDAKIELRNNHLGYAITWFGLAGALACVTAAFAFKRRRE